MNQTAGSQLVDSGDLFDLGQGKLWIGYVLRSVLRRKKAWLASFLIVGALGSFVTLAAPSQYASGTAVIARNDARISETARPGSIASNPDPPANLAQPTIKADTNLNRLVDQLDLVANYRTSEGGLSGIMRKITEGIFGAPNPADQRKEVVDLLRTNISVNTTDGKTTKQTPDAQTVEIGVLWNDPVMAQKIVKQVSDNFFEDRRKQEVGPVEEGKRIAEQEKAKQDKEVEDMRFDLNIQPDDVRPLPATSPLVGKLKLQEELDRNFQLASIALKTEEASFKNRYRIVTEPEVPVAPVSGHLVPLLSALVAAAILATFVTTALDVLKGRIEEPWQASRRLNLPLLVDIK